MVSVRKRRNRGRPGLHPPINKPPTLSHHCCSDNNKLPEERNHPENHVLDQDSNPSCGIGEAVASSHAMDSALVTIPASRLPMSLTADKADSLQELELDIEQLELQRAGVDTRSGDDTRKGIDIESRGGDKDQVPEVSHASDFPVQLNRPWSEDEDEEDVDFGGRMIESKIVSRCLVINREMSYVERMEYIFGSSITLEYCLHGRRKGRSRRTLRCPRRIIPSARSDEF